MLNKLVFQQADTRFLWQAAKVLPNEVNKGSMSLTSVCDQDGNLTVIDPFHVYADLWRHAKLRNPFYFPWSTFLPETDLPYLRVIIEILDDIAFLWECDEITKSSTIFIHFRTYIDLLQELLIGCGG